MGVSYFNNILSSIQSCKQFLSTKMLNLAKILVVVNFLELIHYTKKNLDNTWK